MARLKRKSISIFAKLRNYFITGVVVLVPIGITFYLIKFVNIMKELYPTTLKILLIIVELKKKISDSV